MRIFGALIAVACVVLGGLFGLGGLAVTVLAFPLGIVLGLPMTVAGWAMAGAGLAILAAADRG